MTSIGSQSATLNQFAVRLALLALLAIGEACTSQSASTPPESRLVAKSQSIVSGAVQIDAGKFASYRIDVSPNMLEATIKGSFTASGGSGNDVQVAIGDQMNITNWTNSHQSSVLWETPGQVTTGAFDVKLKPGTYFLVISNKFSVLSDKSVTVEANLGYSENESVNSQ